MIIFFAAVYEDAVSGKQMQVEGRSSSASAAISRTSGLPEWIVLLFGVWNSLLTAGIFILANKVRKLKNS